jgi:hypothetical protein
MNFVFEKQAFDALKALDFSSVKSLMILKRRSDTIVSINPDDYEEFELGFTEQIVLKGLTDDQEHCTDFGKKLYQIYDDMVAQANEYFENGMPRHSSSKELTDKEREENIDIL